MLHLEQINYLHVMNNFTSITILSWETRNWRNQKKIIFLCRDYGLKPVLKNLYIGNLYHKERGSLIRKVSVLLKSKTDRFFMDTVCRTCFNTSQFSDNIVQGIKKNIQINPNFELIQIGKDFKEKS